MDLLSMLALFVGDSMKRWPAGSSGRRFVGALLVLVVGYLILRASL